MKHITIFNSVAEAEACPGLYTPQVCMVEGQSGGLVFAKNSGVEGEQIKIDVDPSGKVVPVYPPTVEFVDLGLSVKWAKCNLGAETETDYGDYYAWGETTTKSDYSWNTYEFGSDSPFSKYDEDGKTELELADDVANASLGGSWRMPTQEDFIELCDTTKVTSEWVTKNGINGREFTSLLNGNTLFIPAVGYYNGSELSGSGRYCLAWSSSHNLDSPYYAYRFYFNQDDVESYNGRDRCYGLSVRPVFQD